MSPRWTPPGARDALERSNQLQLQGKLREDLKQPALVIKKRGRPGKSPNAEEER